MTQRSAQRETMLADIAITAIEGGVNYWARVTDYTWHNASMPEHSTMAAAPGGGGNVRATLHDMEDGGAEHVVTLETVARGMRAILDGCEFAGPGIQALVREANREGEMPVTIDSSAAEEIVQAGVFGRIVYG